MIELIVQILHIIIILLAMASLCTNNKHIIQLSALINTYLLVKWTFITTECGLTILESIIRQKKLKEGFIYRLLQPFINVEESVLYKNMYYIMIVLTLISYNKLYYLYKNRVDLWVM
jgi:hypothetical protein